VTNGTIWTREIFDNRASSTSPDLRLRFRQQDHQGAPPGRFCRHPECPDDHWVFL